MCFAGYFALLQQIGVIEGFMGGDFYYLLVLFISLKFSALESFDFCPIVI